MSNREDGDKRELTKENTQEPLIAVELCETVVVGNHGRPPLVRVPRRACFAPGLDFNITGDRTP